jgi:hypothetical protein
MEKRNGKKLSAIVAAIRSGNDGNKTSDSEEESTGPKSKKKKRQAKRPRVQAEAEEVEVIDEEPSEEEVEEVLDQNEQQVIILHWHKPLR